MLTEERQQSEVVEEGLAVSVVHVAGPGIPPGASAVISRAPRPHATLLRSVVERFELGGCWLSMVDRSPHQEPRAEGHLAILRDAHAIGAATAFMDIRDTVPIT